MVVFMEKVKVLVCGDLTNTIWHPLSRVAEEIKSLLGDDCDIVFVEHFESLGVKGYFQFDVCIFHMENYMDKEGTWPWITNDIVTYVANGGKVLLPHVPEILQSTEISQMFGCRFRMHPPMYDVTFRVMDSEHAITKNVKDFTVFEERHQLLFDNNTPTEVFLTVDCSEGETPAGWSASFGLGKVVYLMPGHHVETYRNEEFRKLFKNAVLWLAEKKNCDR